MFRGKVKGGKGNDQGGVGGKKARNAVNLRVCKDYLRTNKGEFCVAPLHRQVILLLHFLKVSHICIQL